METRVSRAVRLVLLTTDAGGDPRAAWFEGVHAGDLVEVARQGGFHLVEVPEGALRALDPELAAGQLMGPGQPCPLPLVRRATFDVLIALPPTLVTPRQLYEPDEPKPLPRAFGAPSSIRTAKRTIKPGSIVLASIGVEDGWWECEVLAIEARNMVVLRWRDYPGSEEFERQASALAVPPVGGLR